MELWKWKSGKVCIEIFYFFDNLIKYLFFNTLFDDGDIVVVWKLDRLGRSLKDLVSLVEKIGRASCRERV